MNKFLATLIYYFLRLLNWTYRYEFSGIENRAQAIEKSPNQTYIYGIWHQNLAGGILSQYYLKVKHGCIVSSSKDGDLVAYTLEKLGNIAIRGSSTRGGQAALQTMIKSILNGYPGAITIDGPKGPAHIVKKGIVEIARLTQSPIIPYTVLAKHYWSFEKSWDKFRLPKPFTKIFVHYNQPIFVKGSNDQENIREYCLLLKNSLESAEADLTKLMNT